MKTACENLNGSELNGRHIKLIEKSDASERSRKRSPSIGSRSRSRSRSPRARSADNDSTIKGAGMDIDEGRAF